MPPKMLNSAQLKAIKAQQERITTQLKSLEKQQKDLAATVNNLLEESAPKKPPKRPATSPSTAVKASPPKKLRMFDKLEASLGNDVAEAHDFDALIDWDSDEDLIAKFVVPSPNNEGCILNADAHVIICRFIAGIRAERENFRDAVDAFQKVLSNKF